MPPIRQLASIGILLLLVVTSVVGKKPSPDRLLGKFIGSTPREAFIKALSLPDQKDVECTFSLEFFEDASQKPSTYRLTCEHSAYSYQKPKSDQKRDAISKSGPWTLGKSSPHPNRRIFELDCGLRLIEVSKDVLHFLDDKNQLLLGHGGYSYSLHRADAAEKPGDWHLAMAKPDGAPYKIAPVSTGPNVYGVFEGRTPYKGIAEQLNHPWDEGNLKAKWRITLYQDEQSKAPTDYKIEGTFFKPEPRTDKWSLEPGKEGAWSKIILEATKAQPKLVLLMGDDNVLFIADKSGQPLVGHGDFSYTMNRRIQSE